jgi:hypothetical protein
MEWGGRRGKGERELVALDPDLQPNLSFSSLSLLSLPSA